jgi:hypothetical protein
VRCESPPDKFSEEATLIHADVAGYIIAVIEHKQHPGQAYKSFPNILNLKRKVGSGKLINACRRAPVWCTFKLLEQFRRNY